jgi:nucleoside 2-deoxyribosyltransferase
MMRRRFLAPTVPRPVFLAAPGRGAGALAHVEALLRELQVVTGGALRGSDAFVPHLHADDVDPARAFTRTLEALGEARVVVAVLDGPQADDAVAFLVGYAFAAGKPVVGLVTDGRAKAPLLEGALTDVAHDARGLAEVLRKHL